MLNFLKRKKGRKVIVAGLDCADPHLVFERWADQLPTFRTLMERSTYGPLTSTIPAITVPAWSAMFSGKDPGTLGFYGFRNRADYTYHRMTIATGAVVQEPRVWDIAGQANKKVSIVGVPQTYPVRPVNGVLVSGFLTPSTTNHPYTHPAALGDDLQALLGHPYRVDVTNFRTNNKAELYEQIWATTEDHFKVVHHLMTQQPWDLFIFVEIGVDRIHHGFWKYHDPLHPKHEPNNPFEHVTLDYYKYIDAQLGQILEHMDDDTVLFVVSDHGGQAMEGGFCINEWLRQQGYLVLADTLPTPREQHSALGTAPLIPFERVEVDWSKTRAWGAGGYHGRIFINVQGREPEGVIPKADYEAFRNQLIHELSELTTPNGTPMGTLCYKPEEVYSTVRNIPPDLIVYFGNLRWRSVGSFGHSGIFTSENDIGPDDANHAQEGLILIHDPQKDLRGQSVSAHVMDIAPTVLSLMGISVPKDMQGQIIKF